MDLRPNIVCMFVFVVLFTLVCVELARTPELPPDNNNMANMGRFQTPAQVLAHYPWLLAFLISLSLAMILHLITTVVLFKRRKVHPALQSCCLIPAVAFIALLSVTLYYSLWYKTVLVTMATLTHTLLTMTHCVQSRRTSRHSLPHLSIESLASSQVAPCADTDNDSSPGQSCSMSLSSLYHLIDSLFRFGSSSSSPPDSQPHSIHDSELALGQESEVYLTPMGANGEDEAEMYDGADPESASEAMLSSLHSTLWRELQYLSPTNCQEVYNQMLKLEPMRLVTVLTRPLGLYRLVRHLVNQELSPTIHEVEDDLEDGYHLALLFGSDDGDLDIPDGSGDDAPATRDDVTLHLASNVSGTVQTDSVELLVAESELCIDHDVSGETGNDVGMEYEGAEMTQVDHTTKMDDADLQEARHNIAHPEEDIQLERTNASAEGAGGDKGEEPTNPSVEEATQDGATKEVGDVAEEIATDSDEPKTFTLDEERTAQETKEIPKFNVRKAGEGQKDNPKWKKATIYKKENEEASEEDNDEEASTKVFEAVQTVHNASDHDIYLENQVASYACGGIDQLSPETAQEVAAQDSSQEEPVEDNQSVVKEYLATGMWLRFQDF